jgi:alpha-L-rhamnosidase
VRLFLASEKESVEALRNVSTCKGAVTPGGPYPYHYVVEAMLKCGMKQEALRSSDPNAAA